MARIIDSANIRLIGQQVLFDSEVNDFTDEAGFERWVHNIPLLGEEIENGAQLSEVAGRICYTAFGSKQRHQNTDDYIRNIIRQNHGSVLEHAVFTFMVSGISRTLSHELIRHRVGMAVSELSQRYVDLKDVNFVRPPDIWATEEYDIWEKACNASLEAYAQLVEVLAEKMKKEHPTMSLTDRRKHVRQAARSVLPGCTETMMVLTINARTIRHILELRGAEGAEIEIRHFVLRLYRVMQRVAPVFIEDFSIVVSDKQQTLLVRDHDYYNSH